MRRLDLALDLQFEPASFLDRGEANRLFQPEISLEMASRFGWRLERRCG
jgi:hypothetical protein